MSDTPWTDKHRDRMAVHIDDVMELERSHRRLLDALKMLHPRENVWRTPTDEQELIINAAIKQAIC